LIAPFQGLNRDIHNHVGRCPTLCNLRLSAL